VDSALKGKRLNPPYKNCSPIGIAYHVFQMHAGNLCGCGMNEMVGNDLDMERIVAMTGCACITSHFAAFDLAGGAMPYVKIAWVHKL
jgi:hypothetical protein